MPETLHINDFSKIHFIGIGGIGMSALARMAKAFGIKVSGSDHCANNVTDDLKAEGINVRIGSDPEALSGNDLVIYSSAVPETDPERREAGRLGILQMRRAEFLALISEGYEKLIAVAGTHGKTTISSILTTLFYELGMQPSALVGGIMLQFNSNACISPDKKYLIVEADEYDRSFLTLSPKISIINNIDKDHLDIYDSKEDIINTFRQFSRQTKADGKNLICSDDPGIREIHHEIPNALTYGVDEPAADIGISDLQLFADSSKFRIRTAQGESAIFTLNVPGRYNVQNALAAVSVLVHLEIAINDIIPALAAYQGVKRRFELRKKIGSIRVYDDYAHHPAEVRAALATALKSAGKSRVIAVFQPHLYSRTRDFAGDFARELQAADIALITDIYPAREKPIPGISSDLISSKMPPAMVIRIPGINGVKNTLNELLLPGDLILCLGAGDLSFHIDEIIEYISKNKDLAND